MIASSVSSVHTISISHKKEQRGGGDMSLSIVDLKEAEYLDKNKKVSILSELTDNKYFIRYKGKIPSRGRRMCSEYCGEYTGKVGDGSVRSEAWVAVLQTMNDE